MLNIDCEQTPLNKLQRIDCTWTVNVKVYNKDAKTIITFYSTLMYLELSTAFLFWGSLKKTARNTKMLKALGRING